MNNCSPENNACLSEIIGLVPGYDPFRDSDGYWFDEETASKYIRFIEECLRFVKGTGVAGFPFRLALWQKAVIANLFGWKHSQTNFRRYRECMIYVPRKNGKTTLIAAMALALLIVDNEPGGEIYCAASTRSQAAITFSIVRRMIAAEPLLSKYLKAYAHSIVRIDPRTGMETGLSFKCLSSEAPGAHGFDVSAALIDEVHAHPNDRLIEALTTGCLARKQPLIIYTTTADFERESICNRLHHRASQVRDGVLPDTSFLPVIFEAKKDDDWRDEKVWRKANPNYGISIQESSFRSEIQKAIDYPSEQNSIRRLYLNQKTDTHEIWLSYDNWKKCGLEVDEKRLEGQACFAGLDLSSTTDLTAFAMLFPTFAGLEVIAKFWVPQANIEKRQIRDKVPYRDWLRAGWISVGGDESIDHAIILRDIVDLYGKYNIRKIAFDRWNIGNLAQQLSGTGLMLVPFGQGLSSMSSPAKTLERLILDGKINHGNNPVLNWNARNVVISRDAAENIKPDKAKSTERIDGIVALIMAIGLWEQEPKPIDPDKMIFAIDFN